MSDGAVISYSAVVALDYGQFALYASIDPDEPEGLDDELEDPDDDPVEAELALVELALEGDGVAGDGKVLVVLSPHQNNFAMKLEIEVWDRPPAEDLAAWDLAVEGHLDVAATNASRDGELGYGSPTLDFEEWRVPAGDHHVRVTGTGFVAEGWPGSTEPGDHWRVQLWRCDCGAGARRLKQWRE